MSAIPSYAEIIDLLKKGATLEAQAKIMELREALLLEKEKNHTLQLQIQKLDNKLEVTGQLNWDASLIILLKDMVRINFCHILKNSQLIVTMMRFLRLFMVLSLINVSRISENQY